MRTKARHQRRIYTTEELRTLPPTVEVDVAADILGLGRTAAYSAARRGELPVIRVGRRIVVSTARLLAMLDGSGAA